jgi:hypothetical protein
MRVRARDGNRAGAESSVPADRDAPGGVCADAAVASIPARRTPAPRPKTESLDRIFACMLSMMPTLADHGCRVNGCGQAVRPIRGEW